MTRGRMRLPRITLAAMALALVAHAARTGAAVADAAMADAAVADAAEADAVLGILEDVPGKYAGEGNRRAVRVVFEHAGGRWRAFPNDCRDARCLQEAVGQYPAGMDWTVALQGRVLGRLAGVRAEASLFTSDIGIEEIADQASVPAVGDRSEEWAGFGPVPLYRPLVAVSPPRAADPDGWRPAEPSPALVRSFKTEFRKNFPELCTWDADETLSPCAYRDADIRTGPSVASGRGWTLVQLRLENAADCASDIPISGFAAWFVADTGGNIRCLGQWMRLLDAGDYDGDGVSELVFQISGYNLGGYTLFYDDFRGRADFRFAYH